MSSRAASDILPSVVVFVTAVVLGALAYLVHRAWERCRAALRRVSLRARLRESRRLAWYRLTRRWPRYKGRPADGSPRTDPGEAADDAITFGKLAGLYKQRGIYADDPQREKRQS